MACFWITTSMFDDLENWFNILVDIYRNIADLFVIKVDIRVFLATSTTASFRLELNPMCFLTMDKKLNVAMEALITTWLLTLVELCLSVAPMVLASISAWSKCLVAELALEWAFTRMLSFMNLKIWLVLELLTANALFAWIIIDIRRAHNKCLKMNHLTPYF